MSGEAATPKGYLFRCRGAGLKRAEFWRELGFPNLVRARAAYAKIRAERRRQEAAKQFSPFALANERYEDLAPPPKPSRLRRKQVYKSRLKFLRSRDEPSPHLRQRRRKRWSPPERKRCSPPKSP
jgi:hypothetical protein